MVKEKCLFSLRCYQADITHVKQIVDENGNIIIYLQPVQCYGTFGKLDCIALKQYLLHLRKRQNC